jgi:hypothetical protein
MSSLKQKNYVKKTIGAPKKQDELKTSQLLKLTGLILILARS